MDPHNGKIVLINDWRREMSADLMILEKELSERRKNLIFSAYTTDLQKISFLAREGMGREEERFIKDTDICISAEGMSGISLMKKRDGKRILIGAAAPQLFNARMAVDHRRPTNIGLFYDGFTHVLPGSPFVYDLLKKTCRDRKTRYLTDVCTPLAMYMATPSCRDRVKEELKDLYPQLVGKKIIAIAGYGSPKKQKSSWLQEVSLKRILERMGPEWALVTNLEELLPSLCGVKASETAAFAFLERCHEPYKTAMMADVLVTNHGLWASAFAASGRPLLGMSYGDTGFEQFLMEKYPGLLIRNAQALTERLFREPDEEMRKMSRYLSYPASGKNPFDIISEILDEQVR